MRQTLKMGYFDRVSVFEAIGDAVCVVNFLCSIFLMMFDHLVGLNTCSNVEPGSIYADSRGRVLRNEGWFKVTQIFIQSGVICFLLALPFALLKPFIKKNIKSLEYTVCGLSLGGAIFNMAGWAVFLAVVETNVLNNNRDMEIAFLCSVVTSIFGIIAFIFFTMDIMRSTMFNSKYDFQGRDFHKIVTNINKCAAHQSIFCAHALD